MKISIGSFLILCLAAIALLFIYQFPKTWQLEPQGSHIWRQADCMAMTNNYKENKLPFLQAETYNLQSGHGKSMGEFPIFYYCAAHFSNPMIALRIMHSFVFLMGILACFFVAFYFIRDELLSLLPPLILFTSPLLVFYGNNFLSDVPALSFAYLGWAFFLNRDKNKINLFFFFALICFIMATLLKASQILNFGILIVFLFFIQKEKKQIQLLFVIIFIGIPIAWYSYAKHYNALYHDTYYFLGIFPIWKLSFYEIGLCIWRMTISWSKNYFWHPTSILLIIAFYFLIKRSNKLTKEMRILLISSGTLTLIYILLYFQRMIRHEYYYVLFYVFVVFALIALLQVYKAYYAENIFSHTALFLFLIPNVVFCYFYTQEKLKDNIPNTWLSSSEFQEFLNEHQVTKEKTVLILPDISTNITLNQIHRKGYTAYNNYTETLHSNKADYLILCDSALQQDPSLCVYTQHLMGNKNGILVYRLSAQ